MNAEETLAAVRTIAASTDNAVVALRKIFDAIGACQTLNHVVQPCNHPEEEVRLKHRIRWCALCGAQRIKTETGVQSEYGPWQIPALHATLVSIASQAKVGESKTYLQEWQGNVVADIGREFLHRFDDLCTRLECVADRLGNDEEEDANEVSAR